MRVLRGIMAKGEATKRFRFLTRLLQQIEPNDPLDLLTQTELEDVINDWMNDNESETGA